MSQYLIPGTDFHDETANEGQYLDPGEGFIDAADDLAAAGTARPVVFVAT